MVLGGARGISPPTPVAICRADSYQDPGWDFAQQGKDRVLRATKLGPPRPSTLLPSMKGRPRQPRPLVLPERKRGSPRRETPAVAHRRRVCAMRVTTRAGPVRPSIADPHNRVFAAASARVAFPLPYRASLRHAGRDHGPVTRAVNWRRGRRVRLRRGRRRGGHRSHPAPIGRRHNRARPRPVLR